MCIKYDVIVFIGKGRDIQMDISMDRKKCLRSTKLSFYSLIEETVPMKKQFINLNLDTIDTLPKSASFISDF